MDPIQLRIHQFLPAVILDLHASLPVTVVQTEIISLAKDVKSTPLVPMVSCMIAAPALLVDYPGTTESNAARGRAQHVTLVLTLQ